MLPSMHEGLELIRRGEAEGEGGRGESSVSTSAAVAGRRGSLSAGVAGRRGSSSLWQAESSVLLLQVVQKERQL